MDLVTFHRLVIVVAIVFCAGFAVRGLSLVAFVGRGHGTSTALLAAGAGAAAVGLGFYLRWLRRTMPGPR